MTSTITDYTNLIDTTFPNPRIDNNSQGFRTNFSLIKTALNVAANEIDDLDTNLIDLAGINNFNGNLIQNATVSSCTFILQNYTLSQLSVLTAAGVENGTLVFVTDTVNSPAYYSGGSWYAITGTVFTP